MENYNKKHVVAAAVTVSLLALSGCQTRPAEYLPGYYQEARYHPARNEYAYYDYYGSYHASYQRDAYYESGRWHRAPVVSRDNIQKTFYVESALAEEEATEALGDVAGEGSTIEYTVR